MEPNNTCKKCRCLNGNCSANLVANEPSVAVDPLDLLAFNPLPIEYIDVEIPIFNPKINVNMDEELEPLKEETIIDLDLEKVMNNIENTANFNSIEESLHALNYPDTIFTRLQNAFNTFKEATGRQMSYSEMRNMMG